MERDIVDIVKDKNFNQLTAEEREELKDFCTSEEEFFQLKSVFATLDSIHADELSPRPETKEKLDALFHETYPGTAPIWYNSLLAVAIPREKPLYRQPLLQIAALVAVILLAVPLFDSNVQSDNQLMAEADIPEQEISQEEESVGAGNIESNDESAVDLSSADKSIQQSYQWSALDANTGMADDVVASRTITSTIGVGAGSSAPGTASNHPDGIFDFESESLSVSASDTPDLLDLLTSTF